MRFRVILKKELRENVRKKSFLAFVLLMPAFLIGFPLVLQSLVSTQHGLRIGIIDHSDGSFAQGLVNSKVANLNLTHYSSEKEMIDNIINGNIDAGMIIPSDINTENITVYVDQRNVLSFSFSAILNNYRGVLSRAIIEQALNESGVKNTSSYFNPFLFSLFDVSGQATQSPSTFAQILPVIIFVVIIFSGQFMAESLAGEKERKTIELLLSTPATKSDIITGKILAIALPIIAQVVLWFLLLTVISPYIGGAGLIDLFALAQSFVYFILAVLIFCTFGVIISSITSTVKEAQQYLGILILPFYIFGILPTELMPQVIQTVLPYIPVVSVAAATRQTLVGRMSLFSFEGIYILLTGIFVIAIFIYIGSKIFERRMIR